MHTHPIIINASQRIDNRPEHAINNTPFASLNVCMLVLYGGVSTWCIYVARGTLQEKVWEPLRYTNGVPIRTDGLNLVQCK